VLMITNLDGSLSSNKIFLVSLAGWNCSTGDWLQLSSRDAQLLH
jgi:hypothetical protein